MNERGEVVAHASGERHGRVQEPGGMGCLDRGDAGAPRERERPRAESVHRGAEGYPVLDLFSGYGGFTLAFGAVAYSTGARRSGTENPGTDRYNAGQGTWREELERGSAFRTIAFAEIEPYAAALLAERFPHVPNFGDVATITRDAVLARCGVLPAVITGGFPCQPHSTAGKRGASADERDLWPECVRVLRDLRPRFALFENVPGLLTSESGLFFNRVLSDLADVGYACAWQVVSAADLGAPHLRERVWMLCWDELADRERAGLEGHAGDGAGGNEPGRDVSGTDRLIATQGVRSGAPWPALAGLWPAGPDRPQHAWEPPRTVVGHAQHQQWDGPWEGQEGAPSLQTQAQGKLNPAWVEALQGVPLGWTQLSEKFNAKRFRDARAKGTQPVPGDTVNRTHRLKALGNGIVVVCAIPFALAIADVLGLTDAD